ncbi:MAG: hypothetical protein Q9198_006143 [Flavoplaca austrocitrina]
MAFVRKSVPVSATALQALSITGNVGVVIFLQTEQNTLPKAPKSVRLAARLMLLKLAVGMEPSSAFTMIRPSISQIVMRSPATIDIIDLSIGYHNVKNVDIDINVKLRIVDLDDIKPVDVPRLNFDIDVFERHIFDLTNLILTNLILTNLILTNLILTNVDLPNFHLPNFHLPNLDFPDLDFPDLDFPDLDFPDLDFPDLDFPDLNVQ